MQSKSEKMGTLEVIMESSCLRVYSPKYDEETDPEFVRFMLKFRNVTEPQHKKCFDAILSAINKMYRDTGARENLFRPEIGSVKAMPLFVHLPKKNRKIGLVRLYCIRISDRLLILGNGDIKRVQTFQEDPILYQYVKDLRKIIGKIKRFAAKDNIDFDDFDRMVELLDSIKI